MLKLKIKNGTINMTIYSIGLLLADKILRLTPNRLAISKAIRNPLKAIEISPKPEINQDSIMKVEYFQYREINQYLHHFITTLKKNEHGHHLTNFYENLEDITIKISKNNILRKILNYIFNKNSDATYDWDTNTVEMFNELSSASHEFLHAATTKTTVKNFYCGFEQYYKDTDTCIGEGLNEGYTSIIDERYFKMENTYIVEKYMAQQLEYIVGRKNMEDMYFENDLKGLIGKISNYMLEKDCFTFIFYLDIVCENFSDNKIIPNQDENLILNYLFDFILKLHVRKQYAKIEKKNWTAEKLEQYIWNEYVSSDLFLLEYYKVIYTRDISEMLHCAVLDVCEENKVDFNKQITKKSR